MAERNKPAAQQACALSLLLAMLLASLVACAPVPATESRQPSLVTETPSPAPTESQPEKTSTPEGCHLQPIAPFGPFSSKKTVVLPDGIWYDTQELAALSRLEGLTVETDGPGRPTLSRREDTEAILTIMDSSDLTFRNIRFGYDCQQIDQAASNGQPLIRILSSKQIVFEGCDFFSASGPAVFLEASEQVIFKNCTFYQLPDAPFETRFQDIPSQLTCSDCLFETVASGLLALNVHRSVFDRCTWIGHQGYRMPVAAFEQAEADHLATSPGSLASQLDGVLAARVDHHLDDSQKLTVINTVFASDEVFGLYEAMAQNQAAWLPDQALDWSLSGQKIEAVPAGQALDPRLGLTLSLRVRVGADAEAPETGQPHYSLADLRSDLSELKGLEAHLDPLLTGSLQLALSDQERQPLLAVSLPIQGLQERLEDPRAQALEEDVLLLNPGLVPAAFFGLEGYGTYAARYFLPLLEDAFSASDRPLLVQINDEQPLLVSYLLTYEDSRLQEGVVLHRFSLGFHAGGLALASGGATPDNQHLLTLWIRADQGAKLLERSGRLQPVRLPDAAESRQLQNWLNQPLDLDDGRRLFPLSAFTDESLQNGPVLLDRGSDDTIWVLSFYFTEAFQLQAVEQRFSTTDASWQRLSAKVSTG